MFNVCLENSSNSGSAILISHLLTSYKLFKIKIIFFSVLNFTQKRVKQKKINFPFFQALLIFTKDEFILRDIWKNFLVSNIDFSSLTAASSQVLEIIFNPSFEGVSWVNFSCALFFMLNKKYFYQ